MMDVIQALRGFVQAVVVIGNEFAAVRSEIAALPIPPDLTQYGVTPRIYYTGSGWPARAASVPAGYTGPVEYISDSYSGAPDPAGFGALEGDSWLRVKP